LTAGPARPIVAPVDLTRFLIAAGLVPLLFVRVDPTLVGPPWSFALTPGWSLSQLLFIAVAGGVLGVTSSRPAHGLAAVTLGVLAGLALDLWWFAGQVTAIDQAFVTLLARDEWWSRTAGSAIVLAGAMALGFLVGAVARWMIRGRGLASFPRPNRSEAAAIGVAAIGAPVLALAIAFAGAASPIVVPDGAQVQVVSVMADSIVVNPVTMRPGPTHFRCQFAPDATSEWISLVVARPIVDIESDEVGAEDLSLCGPRAGSEAWGPVAEVPPGRYMWIQWDQFTEVPRLGATSPVFVVGP
jgi:hypothetical protein